MFHKTILPIIFSVGIFTFAFAEEPKLPDLDLGKAGKLSLLQGPVKPELVGRFDRIILLPSNIPAEKLNPEKDGKLILETEGRRLLSWSAQNLDKDETPAILLTFDPGGGSGGFVDFTLLCASGSTFAPIWEETLKAGSASFSDKDGDGIAELILTFLDQVEPRKEAATQTAVLKFKDRKLSVIEGKLHSDPEPAK